MRVRGKISALYEQRSGVLSPDRHQYLLQASGEGLFGDCDSVMGDMDLQVKEVYWAIFSI